MEYARILHKNWWKYGTILSSTNDNPQFPSEDTQNETKQFFWRTKATYVSAQSIIIDLGAAIECNMVALLNHNLTAAATIQMKGADDAAITSNVVTETVTHNDSNLFFFFAAARTKRYWQLLITDAANPDTFLQVGPIVLGKYWTVSENFSYQYERGVQDFSELEFTDSRVVSAIVKKKGEEFALPFKSLTDASAENVRALVREVGVHSPFVLCLDYNYPNTNSYWIRLANLARPKCNAPDLWEWNPEVTEAF